MHLKKIVQWIPLVLVSLRGNKLNGMVSLMTEHMILPIDHMCPCTWAPLPALVLFAQMRHYQLGVPWTSNIALVSWTPHTHILPVGLLTHDANSSCFLHSVCLRHLPHGQRRRGFVVSQAAEHSLTSGWTFTYFPPLFHCENHCKGEVVLWSVWSPGGGTQKSKDSLLSGQAF